MNDKEISQIIRNNNFDDTLKIRNRIKRIREIQEKYSFYNPNMFRQEIMDHKFFPTSEKEIGVLNRCYLIDCLIVDLSSISPHSASWVRNLDEKHGFMFQKDDKGKNRCFRKLINGKKVLHRRIYAINENKIDEDKPSNYIKISVKLRKQIRESNGGRDPITGSSKSLEIDHRKPAMRCFAEGISPAYLQKEDVENDTYLDDFQIISKLMNMIKKAECEKAFKDKKKIFVPSSLQFFQDEGIFIQYCIDNKGCDECYYGNLDRIPIFILQAIISDKINKERIQEFLDKLSI